MQEARTRLRLVRMLATTTIVAAAVVGLAPTANAADFASDVANPTYTCGSDNDPTTTSMLGLLPGGVSLSPQVSVAQLSPGPAQGATFSPQFSYSATLPPSMVSMATGLGLTSVNVTGMTLTISAGAGVSGGPLVAPMPDQTIVFATSTGFSVGPLSGPFTRTAADGQSLSFVAGDLRMSISLSFNGAPITLKMLCTPSGDTTVTMSTSGSSTTSTSTTSTTSQSTTSTSTTNTVPGTASSTTSTTVQRAVEVPSTVTPGGSFSVAAPGWKPGTEVTATLHSDPVVLGQLPVGSDGVATGNLTVPASVPVGAHTLELTGTGADGQAKSTSTPMSVAVAQATYLPAGSIVPAYTCGDDNDPTTAELLGLFGGPVVFNPEVVMSAISPSPAQGASFTPAFDYTMVLPDSMLDMVAGIGVTSVTMTGMTITVSAGDGVSGGPLVSPMPDQTIVFANASGFSADFGGTSFTRTSAIGSPVAFVAGDLRMTISLSFNGAPISLRMRCTASGATVLSVTDVAGTPPPDPKAGVTTTTPPGATAPAELARTGKEHLELTLLAGILLGLGVASINEGALRKWRQRPTVQ